MKIKRETTNAANTEVKIPMINVVANDSIGPDPKIFNTIAVNNVVTLASIIDDKAFLYPSSIAACFSLPFAISSRILQKQVRWHPQQYR